MGFKIVKSINYESQYPPDFMTHLNYVSCLNKISDGLSIGYNMNFKKRLKHDNQLDKKLTLIELTRKNLEEEYKIISANPDYAEVCVPWVSVKAYYLLFNLLLIIKYLLSGDIASFISSHDRMLKDFKEYIKKKTLCFNKDLVNHVHKAKDIQKIRFASGYNVKLTDVDLEKRFQQILKKLLAYKIEDFQRKSKIVNFRKKKSKEERDSFIDASDINICEFFYLYRIKANYRDLEFLDKNIGSNQFKDFYENYYGLTMNFYKALKDLINELSIKRLGKEILFV